MKFMTPKFSIALFTVLIALSFTITGFGQKSATGDFSTGARLIYPHDFSDKYYAANGVVSSAINGRLTGADFLSVPEQSSDPRYAHVRVLITLAARSASQEAIFWNPLGTLRADGFTRDEAGNAAFSLATSNPMYVFTDGGTAAVKDESIFANMRQAVVFDDTNVSAGSADQQNPLGLRLIITARLLPAMTRKQQAVYSEMGARNGFRPDGMPIVRTPADISTLSIYNLIELSKGEGEVAIAPTLGDGLKIAKDAFLSVARYNGEPLEAESDLIKIFSSLQAQ